MLWRYGVVKVHGSGAMMEEAWWILVEVVERRSSDVMGTPEVHGWCFGSGFGRGMACEEARHLRRCSLRLGGLGSMVVASPG